MKKNRKVLWISILTALFLTTFIGSCKKDKFIEETGICPIVKSTSPTSGAVGVPLNQVVKARFNEGMNPATITQTSFSLYALNKTKITGTITYNELDSSLNFVPTYKFTPNTTYTGTVETTVKDLKGNALQTPYIWSFSTGAVIVPTVLSTDPANNDTGVALNKIITAVFSVPMDSLTINTTTFTIRQGLTPVAGTVSYTGTTATFIPVVALISNLTYTGTITTGATSKDAVSLLANYVWTFKTGSIIAPRVILTDPLNLATNVSLSKVIGATFSEAMDPLTISTSTFTLMNGVTPVSGVVNYSGVSATFTPTINLIAGITYTATVTSGAKNVAGVPMANNHVWTFTTLSAPTVILTDPLNLASGVALNKVIAATFSQTMDPATITTSTFTLMAGLTPVSGVVAYTGTTATFTPGTNLLSGVVYTATVTTGVKNLAGIAMVSNHIWTFTTLTTAAPTVISTDPLNLATGVALNKIIGANFSQAMDPLTITTSTFTLMNGLVPVSGVVSYSGITATFTPTVNLLPGIVYTATITTGAKNLAGTSLASNYVWTFTTLAGSAPTVVSTDPSNLAINVPLNKVIGATFSQAMDPATITTLSFTLKLGLASITGVVNYSGLTATFTPSGNLISDNTYTATITTSAKNLAGTSIVSNYVWTFNTVGHLGPQPPVLGAAAPFGAFGGSAGVTNMGINTIINNGGIGTTGASTLITGFHHLLTVYTETTLNIGNSTGGIFTAPPLPGTATSLATAQACSLAAQVAYLSISPASKPGGIDPGAGELGGLTLAPGIYKAASGTFNISNGPLTLDAQGDPNAVWIFQTAAGLTVGIAGPAGARSVNMINGGLPKNVFWYVGSTATINGAGGGIMVGTIIANSGVTFSTAGNAVQTRLDGRALSLISSVTMVNTTINVP